MKITPVQVLILIELSIILHFLYVWYILPIIKEAFKSKEDRKRDLYYMERLAKELRNPPKMIHAYDSPIVSCLSSRGEVCE